jgi:single-strand DNA-binding protein
MVNRVMQIGEVSEMIKTTDGEGVDNECVFKIVTENASRDANGKKVFTRRFQTVVANNKLGMICSQFLRRGTPVWIEGRLEDRPDPSIADSERMAVVINCVIMKILGKEILKAMEREQQTDGDDYNYNQL